MYGSNGSSLELVANTCKKAVDFQYDRFERNNYREITHIFEGNPADFPIEQDQTDRFQGNN